VVAQLKEAAALRVKGKLGLASSGSMGSRRFSGAFMRQLTMSPGGSTWQARHATQSLRCGSCMSRYHWG
jgi:hypothetical protein